MLTLISFMQFYIYSCLEIYNKVDDYHKKTSEHNLGLVENLFPVIKGLFISNLYNNKYSVASLILMDIYNGIYPNNIFKEFLMITIPKLIWKIFQIGKIDDYEPFKDDDHGPASSASTSISTITNNSKGDQESHPEGIILCGCKLPAGFVGLSGESNPAGEINSETIL